MIRIYSKGVPAKLSEHFSSIEFDCHCKRPECKQTWIDDELIFRLEDLRARLGKAVHIDSGYRCQGHQVDLMKTGLETAKGISTHTQGKAADIWVSGESGKQLAADAKLVGFTSIGTAGAWIHVDMRLGEHSWTYSSPKNAKDFTHKVA